MLYYEIPSKPRILVKEKTKMFDIVKKTLLTYPKIIKQIFLKTYFMNKFLLKKYELNSNAEIIIKSNHSKKYFYPRYLIEEFENKNYFEKEYLGTEIFSKFAEVPKILKIEDEKLFKEIIDFDLISFNEVDEKKFTKIMKITEKIRNYDQKNNLYFSHGDFHLGNVKFYKDKIYLIDFDNYAYMPKYYDILHFILIPLIYNKNFAKKSFELFNIFSEKYDIKIKDIRDELKILEKRGKEIRKFIYTLDKKHNKK